MIKGIFNIILLFLPFMLHGGIITVCADCSYKTIVSGIEAANNCDTLLIKNGLYIIDNININKSLTIIGEEGAILESREGDEILTITAPYVTISNLTLRNVTNSYIKERSAIRVVKQNDFNIENNVIKDCFFAIYLENAKNGVIKGNTIEGNATTDAESGNGVHAWYCTNILVIENTIKGHRDGIYFEFVNESSVLNNLSEQNNRYGLHFMFSNDDEYRYNIFNNNGVGVAVMFSRRIEMHHNEFTFNWGRASYGLLLKEIYDANISNNNFEQNTVGIFVEGSNRIKYYKNQFVRNGWALKFSGGCEDNDVTENNFINNSLDLVVNTKLSSNKFHHNFWSAYTGYDLDKDKIGDVPHYPVKLFSYILDQTPEAIILMRSFFVDLINIAEKISPVFTPKDVMDNFPLMYKVND